METVKEGPKNSKSSSTRLFESNFLEGLTHVHPITPLVLWTPIIGYFLYLGHFATGEDKLNQSLFPVVALAGFVTWTLAEYLMHRVVFHYKSRFKAINYLVYLFHGIHHDEPNDATRLVMPPFPAIVLSSGLYALFALFLSGASLYVFFAFFMIGYLCYDYIHYAIHHFACKGKVLKYLKRHHMLHHHISHGAKYGVSSPLWDFILRTYR